MTIRESSWYESGVRFIFTNRSLFSVSLASAKGRGEFDRRKSGPSQGAGATGQPSENPGQGALSRRVLRLAEKVSWTVSVPKAPHATAPVPTTTFSVPSAGPRDRRSALQRVSRSSFPSERGSFSSECDSFSSERGTRQSRPWLSFSGARPFSHRAWLDGVGAGLFSGEARLFSALAPSRRRRRRLVRQPSSMRWRYEHLSWCLESLDHYTGSA